MRKFFNALLILFFITLVNCSMQSENNASKSYSSNDGDGLFDLPSKSVDESAEKLIFPASYSPVKGQGFAIIQKLGPGDYFLKFEVRYNGKDSKFDGNCYQSGEKLYCPIEFDLDDDFKQRKSYIEVQQINPGEIKIKAFYKTPGLFQADMPDNFHREVLPGKMMPVKVAPSIGKFI